MAKSHCLSPPTCTETGCKQSPYLSDLQQGAGFPRFLNTPLKQFCDTCQVPFLSVLGWVSKGYLERRLEDVHSVPGQATSLSFSIKDRSSWSLGGGSVGGPVGKAPGTCLCLGHGGLPLFLVRDIFLQASCLRHPQAWVILSLATLYF